MHTCTPGFAFKLELHPACHGVSLPIAMAARLHFNTTIGLVENVSRAAL